MFFQNKFIIKKLLINNLNELLLVLLVVFWEIELVFETKLLFLDKIFWLLNLHFCFNIPNSSNSTEYSFKLGGIKSFIEILTYLSISVWDNTINFKF